MASAKRKLIIQSQQGDTQRVQRQQLATVTTAVIANPVTAAGLIENAKIFHTAIDCHHTAIASNPTDHSTRSEI